MKLTNKMQLPNALFRAISSDPYTKGKSDFSVTELLQPPRIRALKLKHAEEIEEDVGDRVWSLLGQSVHTILERANDDKRAIAEKRYFGKFGKYTVSAQIDSLDLDSGVLSDYKVTTAWGFLKDNPPKPEWVQQLNMQLMLLRMNGLDARELKIVGILRDFNLRESKNNPNYPKFQVATADIVMWSREETTAFIEDRIRLHLSAEVNLPYCSDEEKWSSPSKFAVMKGSNKRAVKLVDSLIEAQDYLANGAGDRIEARRGEARRCTSYCPVNKFCSVYQQTIKEQSNAIGISNREM
jgi:hypothetical protein